MPVTARNFLNGLARSAPYWAEAIVNRQAYEDDQAEKDRRFALDEKEADNRKVYYDAQADQAIAQKTFYENKNEEYIDTKDRLSEARENLNHAIQQFQNVDPKAPKQREHWYNQINLYDAEIKNLLGDPSSFLDRADAKEASIISTKLALARFVPSMTGKAQEEMNTMLDKPIHSLNDLISEFFRIAEYTNPKDKDNALDSIEWLKKFGETMDWAREE